jgi:hypothetical protein
VVGLGNKKVPTNNPNILAVNPNQIEGISCGAMKLK